MQSREIFEKSSGPPFSVRGFFSNLLWPPIVHLARIPCDADAFPLEHARDGPGAAADLDSRAAQPLEGFDAGPVVETDAGQVPTHRATGASELAAFARQ